MHFNILSSGHVLADESRNITDISNTLPLSKTFILLATFFVDESSHLGKLFNLNTGKGFCRHIRHHHRRRAVFQENLTAFDHRPCEMKLHVDEFRALGGSGIVGNFHASLVVGIYLDRFHSHITSNSNIAHSPARPYCFLICKTQPNILRLRR
jgi:hypothetical protein